MNSDLTTYSQRAAAIAEILSDDIDVSSYAVTAHSSNPEDLDMVNGLDEIRSNRDQVADFTERGESHYTPASASEVAADRADEYVFLFNYIDDVRALVGDCQVTIMPSLTLIKRFDNKYLDLELADFADAALNIGRTVGCSPYEDDFVRPDFPEKWKRHGWTAFPTSPQQD